MIPQRKTASLDSGQNPLARLAVIGCARNERQMRLGPNVPQQQRRARAETRLGVRPLVHLYIHVPPLLGAGAGPDGLDFPNPPVTAAPAIPPSAPVTAPTQELFAWVIWFAVSAAAEPALVAAFVNPMAGLKTLGAPARPVAALK